jgi:type IV secretion system protein VirB9
MRHLELLTCVALAGVAQAAPAAPSRAAHPSHQTAASSAAERSQPAAKARLAGVAIANRSALREPSGFGYVNAAQVYPWSEGALYRLYAAPELVSDIALQAGETLISVAAGDTARWVIDDTTSGSGTARRTHVLIKPTAPGLHTNLVITTDRRVYLLALQSTSGAAMAAVAWTYPEDELLALRRSREAAIEAAPVAEGIAVDRLNFGYAIEGARAPWRPIRAFDDGSQVFIEFPPTVGVGDIPPLFVLGTSGKAELVNYRQRGRYYVVDRLFSTAELRLGEKHQQVVRITRLAPRSRRSGRGS